MPHQRFSHGHGSRPSRRNPRPPASAAKSTNSSADRPLRIGDQAVAPGQARDDHHRERDQADGAVDEDGIGRRPPAGAAARHQPQPDRVAADRGGQCLVEEGSDHVEAHRLPGRQRRAALRADLAPSQHADEYLQERHGNRHADPAQAGNVDAANKLGKVDLAQREIQAAPPRPVSSTSKAGYGAFRPCRV